MTTVRYIEEKDSNYELVKDELGDVILNPGLGRKSKDDITICDLTGTGVQDTVIARFTFDIAMIKKLVTKI